MNNQEPLRARSRGRPAKRGRGRGIGRGRGPGRARSSSEVPNSGPSGSSSEIRSSGPSGSSSDYNGETRSRHEQKLRRRISREQRALESGVLFSQGGEPPSIYTTCMQDQRRSSSRSDAANAMVSEKISLESRCWFSMGVHWNREFFSQFSVDRCTQEMSCCKFHGDCGSRAVIHKEFSSFNVVLLFDVCILFFSELTSRWW